MKQKFEVGDRVTCLGVSSDGRYVKGETGVVCIIDDESMPPIGVRWDEYSGWKHNCNKSCEYGNGWYVYEEDLVLIVADIPEDSDFDIGELL